MLQRFEEVYMKEYWKLQTQQWENYFEEGKHDLSLVDADVCNLSKLYDDKIDNQDRRSKIASMLVKRNLVDKNALTSKLRNRIDNFENYSSGISSEVKADRYQYRLALSREMKSDVMELIMLRNKFSGEKGFSSYPELVLELEEIIRNNLINTLQEYLQYSLPKVRKLIKKYNIRWETWFKDIGRIDTSASEDNPVDLVNKLLQILGFDEVRSSISIKFMNQGYSGVASEVSPKDIRIVVEPVTSLSNLRTLFHEVGHAISYSLNGEEGIFRMLPSSQDEAMAVVMEYIAPLLLLHKSGREKIHEIMTLEYTRCAISALYEFELWEKPEAAEELYIKHYSMLGFEIKHPGMWASDTFRSIDPVYIHNYVVGAVLGEKLIKYLQGEYSDDYIKWGRWLYENIYKHGRGRPFREMIMGIEELI